MDAIGLMINGVLLAANAFLFVAAMQKFDAATRLMNETRQIANRLALRGKRK